MLPIEWLNIGQKTTFFVIKFRFSSVNILGLDFISHEILSRSLGTHGQKIWTILANFERFQSCPMFCDSTTALERAKDWTMRLMNYQLAVGISDRVRCRRSVEWVSTANCQSPGVLWPSSQIRASKFVIRRLKGFLYILHHMKNPFYSCERLRCNPLFSLCP